jgi:hypothetical protein
VDNPSDHDLLLGISFKVNELHEIVKGAPGKDGLVDRVDSLETSRTRAEEAAKQADAAALLAKGGLGVGGLSLVAHAWQWISTHWRGN